MVRIIPLLVVLLFLITNLTYLNVYLPHSYPYRYCADQCRFEDQELGKGRDPLGRVEVNFLDYRAQTNNYQAVLHRRFPREWWQIWNWVDFLTHKRWSYPYAETDEET